MTLYDIEDLRERINRIDQQLTTQALTQVRLWQLLGRCSMAFDLLTTARKLGDVHEVAAQMLAEIKKATEAHAAD
jgi:hypothetical protein